MRRDCDALGDLPLVVISRGRPSLNPTDFPQEVVQGYERAWAQMQAELAALSSNSSYIMAERSGHLINNDQPELLVDRIRQVVYSGASRTPEVTALRAGLNWPRGPV